VVVFDEPTHGLDPVWTNRFRDIVAGLRQPGRAIVIASHSLDELERLCDRVAIIDHGKIQRIVSVREARGTGSVRRWRLRAAVGADVVAAQFEGATFRDDTIECTVDVAELNRGVAAAIAQGALVTAIAPAESSLEEAFRAAVSR
jgi:ABC-2 type transport system ATP-binding protein